MKPPVFEYVAPKSQAEAVSQLNEFGDGAKLLAGGQSLVPLLNFRLGNPEVLIDLNTAAGLDALMWDDETQEIVFGPMVRQSDAEKSDLVKRHCPLMVEALKYVGHRAIRNRGTIGGSLAHSDPVAELPLVLTALNGRVKLASVRGERWVSASDFFITFLTTAMDADEMLVEARFPGISSEQTGWSFDEMARRHGDFAMAAVATTVQIDQDGQMMNPTVTIAGGLPVPMRASVAENALCGQVPSVDLIQEASQLAVADCEVDSDIHASGTYRRHLISVLVERGLLSTLRGMDALPS